MESTVIVGAQWGDEGKGKITNFLAQRMDIVARFSGGNNAGHTVVIGDKKFKLHHVPSGIFYPEKLCILGSGMVINLEILKKELDSLNQEGISGKNLRISENAHLIMPYHILLDEYQEKIRGGKKLGTTCRGIGPAYVDKVARDGIRVIDLYDTEVFEEKFKFHYKENEKILYENKISFEQIKDKFAELAGYFKPFVTDTSLLLSKAISQGKKILFEGAQGALLDLDFGTYPFVTSASTLSGGASSCLGIPPYAIKKVIGVAKAYTTRVGTGPFPTELKEKTGEYLLEKGAEYGTTTGRPRRCGWLDLVILRYAARINGITSLAVTKLDVLGGLSKIRVASAYKYKGKILKDFPQSLKVLEKCEPVYEEIQGWKKDIGEIRVWEDLPGHVKKYIDLIQNILDVPVEIISVGPEKNQTILVDGIKD